VRDSTGRKVGYRLSLRCNSFRAVHERNGRFFKLMLKTTSQWRVIRTGSVDGGRFVTELALDERVRNL
jgi:hypothetical protein